MSYQVRTNCVYWSENAAMAQKSPLSNSVFVDQKTYKLKNSYRTDPSPLQVILGTALVVKNSPLPIEYIRVLFELQEPLTTRQYHSEWFKLCRQNPMHYDINTLEIPGSCRGYKNYKKVIIKKLYTKQKNSKNHKKYTNEEIKLNKSIEMYKQQIEYCKQQIVMSKKLSEEGKLKLKRLEDAIESI